MLGAGAPGQVTLPGVVARVSLYTRLSAAAQRGDVTLVSAPPGSGKTILLRSWIAAADLGDRTAWVSVEPGEQDDQHFWLQVVDALRAIGASAAIVDRRTATPDFDSQGFVRRLVDDLEALDQQVILVIDDLHELSMEAQDQLGGLVARRPRQLAVVVSTRHDPVIGLHRLRVRGELMELRAADLRFTAAETLELLQASGLPSSDAVAAALHARTEGWAAGVRLAALALAGSRDPERFIGEFSGTERTVADYLVAEVLDQQPEEVRELLLGTSILDRVCGPLADRLLGITGSDRLLLRLEASNAFVASLDPDRYWFRYHQLFADLLRLELRRTSPERVPTLHSIAADWYSEHGLIVDALRHRSAAEDWPGVARSLAEHGFSLVLDGHGATIDRVLGSFPEDQLGDPELLALRAYRELSERSLDAAAELLALAERLAESVPRDERRRVDLALTLTRLALARRRGDLEAALQEVRPFLEPIEAHSARELTAGADARAFALMKLGIVELWSGRLADAQRHLEGALTMARELERPFVEIGCLSHLALVLSTRSFQPAQAAAHEALRLADAHGWAADPIAATALASLAAMDTAQGRFDAARARLVELAPLLRAKVEPAAALFVQFVWGDLLSGEGRLGEAVDAYLAAEQFQDVLTTRHILSRAVCESIAFIELRRHDLAAARSALASLVDDDRRSAEAHVAIAALQLSDDAPTDAIETIDHVLSGDVPAVRVGTMVQALVVAAVAHDRVGDQPHVEGLVEQAFDLAEPDGLVFPFLVTPAPGLIDILERHPRHRTAHAALLSDVIDLLRSPAPTLQARRPQALTEDLSESELRVLRYLPSNLSASEIAAELYVSTSTVKTHMRHIYEKLDAHRRTDAVDRARALGLLGPSGPRRS